jgi:hypothetical protein
MLLRGPKEDRVISVRLESGQLVCLLMCEVFIETNLHMFLQVLGTFERFSAKVTFVRLQWDVDADMRSDVVTLDGGGTAGVPSTGQVQVISALPSNVLLTDMVLGGG